MVKASETCNFRYGMLGMRGVRRDLDDVVVFWFDRFQSLGREG